MTMPPIAPVPRAERITALRRRIILDAAERVFGRDGLEATTIRAIAKEAGCTTGAIYPWFSGKEAIYGELLAESLDRLHAYVSEALQASGPEQAARGVVRAFFTYYADRPTDFSLGLYLYRGLAPHGLGREMDERLNARLRQCVALLGEGLARTRDWPAPRAALEEMTTFTYLMGLLLLHHTRRLKSLDQQAETLLDHYCTSLEQR
ncbi:TetR/AcrR family transcriptional regulator [Pseudomonadota bacterium AL_CKDN230030165-1A_HGKHYDSX7]